MNRIFLQAGYTDDLFWMLGGIIVLALVWYITRRQQSKEASKHAKTSDPYQNVVNDSSYNIDREGIDGHRADGLSKDEARRQTDTYRETNELPSEEEFRDLQKDLRRDEPSGGDRPSSPGQP